MIEASQLSYAALDDMHFVPTLFLKDYLGCKSRSQAAESKNDTSAHVKGKRATTTKNPAQPKPGRGFMTKAKPLRVIGGGGGNRTRVQ
jgi:hypothetical protein